MVQPEMSPMRPGAPPSLGTRHLSADDIELPPVPGTTTQPVNAVDETVRTPAATRPGWRGSGPILIAAGLVMMLAIGSWLWRGASAETNHPNWQPVAAAKNVSAAEGTAVVVQRGSDGTLHQQAAVRVSVADTDLTLTHAVRESLLKNDLNAAEAAVRSALGAAASKDQQTNAVLNPNSRIVSAIRDGSARFFRLRLFDCCDEDGDVVDLSVDGCSYGAVPLTHAGTIISLPLTPGTTIITMRGVRDGGGSITVSFQTSQGDYFSQPLEVGEECQIGVVVQ